MKKILKTKMFYFILGALIFGTIGVSAATYFESNAVIYDNKESGLNSTDVQGAIDELYNACDTSSIPGTGGEILEQVSIVTSVDGLYAKNYIKFNNELWRIISIEPDGIIKILRNSVLSSEIEWDTSNNVRWDKPSSLNTYLNSTYYNTLTEIAKQQIIAYTYDVVSMGTYNISIPSIGDYLRANSNQINCGINNNYGNNNCKDTNWMYINNKNMSYWILTPILGPTQEVYAISCNLGNVVNRNADDTYHMYARPAIYLSSEVQITGGTGTQNDPFRLSE